MKKWVAAVFIALFMLAGAAMAESDSAVWGQEYLAVDDWVYYRARVGNEDVLYRARVDGGKTEELKREPGGFYYLCAMDGWLYYTQLTDVAYDDFTANICRMRLDGSEDQVLGGPMSVRNLLGADGELYVYDAKSDSAGGDAMLRYSVEPWKLIQKIDLPNIDREHFAVENGFLYCLEVEHDCATNHFPEVRRFFRAPVDGTKEIEPWFEPKSNVRPGAWAVENGKLYYSFSDGKTGASELRSVNLDGTGDVLISDARTETRLIYKGWAYGSPLVRSKGGGYVSAQRGTVRLNLNTGKGKVLSKKYESWYLRPTGDYLVYWKSVTNKNDALLMKLDCKEVRRLPKARAKKGGTK